MLGRLIPPCPRGNHHEGPCGLICYSQGQDMADKILMLQDGRKKLFEYLSRLGSPDTATRSRSQNRTPGSADEASWQTSGTR